MVICTPVAQSGVSWVGAFAETVFVAGGRTLPPNICGGQAGRRERTATTCVAYVPKIVCDRSLPLLGREVETIRAELRRAREQSADLAIAYGREIEQLERLYVLMVQRQIEELALFRDCTLHYAAVDGWLTEELLATEPLPRLMAVGGKREKRSEPLPYKELDPWRELLVRSLRLQAAGASREVAETQAEALKKSQAMKVGSAGADLLSANLAEVQELLLSAGLGWLCNGHLRSAEDPLLHEVVSTIRSHEGRRILRAATWLGVDLQAERKPKGGQEKKPDPVKTINALVDKLGGVQLSERKQVSRNRVRLYGWKLPQ